MTEQAVSTNNDSNKKSKKTGSAKGKVAAKKVAEHPTYNEMVKKALVDLKERGGSSRQAILKYILANFKVGTDEHAVNSRLKIALRNGIKSAALKQSKGTGASGSFRLGEKMPVAKKPTVAKKSASPKKPAAGKKATATKKATKPKKVETSPKKAASKPKSTSPAKAAKKPAAATTTTTKPKVPKKAKTAAAPKAKVAKKVVAKPKKAAAPKKTASKKA